MATIQSQPAFGAKVMSPQDLQVQKKRELEGKEESTVPTRTFVPTADIYEDRDSLKVTLEMPGVEKGNVEVRVEKGVLFVEGRLDLSKYRGLQPLYTEYNIGNYARRAVEGPGTWKDQG